MAGFVSAYGRHVQFGYLDAPSLVGPGGKHRAPKHRSDQPDDCCSEVWPCGACIGYTPRHAALLAEGRDRAGEGAGL